MAGRIKPSQAQAIADVLLNPDVRDQLTLSQVATMSSQLKVYQSEQFERTKRFSDEGFSDEQVAQLVDAENQALESGVAGVGKFDESKTPKPPAGARLGQGGQARSVARVLNAGLEGAWQAVEGMGDLASELGVSLNLNSREDADRYKQVVSNDRFTRRMSDIELFGEVNHAGAEFAGKVAPWVMTGSVGGANGLARWALAQGIIGGTAAAGLMSSKTLKERTGDFAIGAGLGVTFQGAFGAPQAVRRKAANMMVGKLNLETSAQRIEIEKGIQEMLQNDSFGFSLAQITGNRWFAGLEIRAAQAGQKTRQNNNIQVLFDHLMTSAKQLGDSGRSADQIALALNKTLTEANRSIHKRASKAFESGLNRLDAEYGADIILDNAGGKNYLYKLDKMLEQLENPLRPGVKASDDFIAYGKEVDRLVNPVAPKGRIVELPDGKKTEVWDLINRRTGEIVSEFPQATKGAANKQAAILNESVGGLQAGELVSIRRGLNDMLAGRTKAVEGSAHSSEDKTISKALMGVLTTELKANNKNPGAVQALDDLRSGYKDEMMLINNMEDMVVNRVFGQSKMPADPDEALDRVLAGGTSSLMATRKFLEQWDDSLLEELQGTYLRRIAEKSIDVKLPDVDVAISLDKMATALGGKEGVGKVGLGLFDASTQADLLLTAKSLRVIKNIYFTGIVPGGSSIDDLTINVISRSPEFMGRFISRALSSGDRMSDFLIDPLTRKAIQRIAEGNLNSPTGVMAMRTLTEFIIAEDHKEVAKRESERKEMMDSMSRR